MAFLFAKSFPFCILPEEETQDIDVGSGTYYPIGMTLTDAMGLFWKSQTFFSVINYSGSATATGLAFEPISFNVSYSQNGQLNLISSPPAWPAKMSEMICAATPVYQATAIGSSAITTIIDGTSVGTQITRIESGVYLFTGDPSIIVRGNTYYPQMSIYSVVQADNIDVPPELFSYNYSASLSSVADGGIQKTNSLSLQIGNKQYKGDLFFGISIGPMSGTIPGGTSASFAINGLNDREAA
jgi:hypothetical protein